MKRTVQIIVIALILTSCFQNKPEIENEITSDIQFSKESETLKSQAISSTDHRNTEEKPYSEVDTLFNSTFTNDWGIEILTSDLLKKQFKFRSDTVRNIHWPAQIDSILYYTTELSKIQIYRVPEKDILLDTDLFDSDIALSSRIKIGTSKRDISEVLSKEINSDTLVVYEVDSGISFTFYFKDDSLYHIHYNCYID